MATSPCTQLSQHDLVVTVAELRRISDDLDRQRATCERAVDLLLDGGWTGAAARGYLEGWEEWRAGSAEVLSGLRTMAELILRAGADLAEADAGSRDLLTSLTARLGERL